MSTSLNLTQAEADALISIEKHREDEQSYFYPGPRTTLVIPLVSANKRERFLLDVNRKYINARRYTYQNRARSVIILVRLDFEGPPHQNPDGVDIAAPHIHLYREGFGDKWAYPVPAHFTDLSDGWLTLQQFMAYCNITVPPIIERGMFV